MNRGNVKGTEFSVLPGPDGAAVSCVTFMITVMWMHIAPCPPIQSHIENTDLMLSPGGNSHETDPAPETQLQTSFGSEGK